MKDLLMNARVEHVVVSYNEEGLLTLEEIGVRFNLTRERVRQIKEKALRRLRHPRRVALLDSLLEPA